jgi:hypothetical protein
MHFACTVTQSYPTYTFAVVEPGEGVMLRRGEESRWVAKDKI